MSSTHAKPSETATAARTRLLDAAGPIFASNGFDGATLREICSIAEVNVASVGYYFGDKLSLYREVIRRVRDDREQRFPVPSDEELDPELVIYRIVRMMLSRMLSGDKTGWESQLMMREMQSPTPVFAEMIDEYFRPLFDRLANTIRELLGVNAEQDIVEKISLGVVGQCLYFRIGAPVIETLIPSERREQHFQIESLTRHVTVATLASCQAYLENATADGLGDLPIPNESQHSKHNSPARAAE